MTTESDTASPLRTRHQLRAEMDACGETVRALATRIGFDEGDVQKVLSGQWRGRYGKAHNIAVALGIKAGFRTDVAVDRAAETTLEGAAA